MGFFSRKVSDSVSFRSLTDKFIELLTEVEMMKVKIAALETSMNSLRGRVNRNLSKDFDDEEETKDLKPGILLPSDHGMA